MPRFAEILRRHHYAIIRLPLTLSTMFALTGCGTNPPPPNNIPKNQYCKITPYQLEGLTLLPGDADPHMQITVKADNLGALTQEKIYIENLSSENIRALKELGIEERDFKERFPLESNFIIRCSIRKVTINKDGESEEIKYLENISLWTQRNGHDDWLADLWTN